MKNAIVNSPIGELIFKINKIFKKLPFIILPDNSKFKINLVKLDTVVKALDKSYSKDISLIYVYDYIGVSFIDIVKTKSKIIISFPIFFFKFLLYLPYKMKIQNNSFNYDGFLGLINDNVKKLPNFFNNN